MKTHCKLGHTLTPENQRPDGHCKICANRQKTEYLQRNPEQLAGKKRRWKLSRLGWTPAMIEQTSVEQGARCAICRQNTRLQPDHKHVKPPQPRGLLCAPCNKALGFLRDNPELCRVAAEYLEAWTIG